MNDGIVVLIVMILFAILIVVGFILDFGWPGKPK